MKNEKFCAELCTHFKKTRWNLGARDFQTVLRAVGEIETQDWLQLDEGDPGFQPLTEENISAVIFF
jgi:hypothetical protein